MVITKDILENSIHFHKNVYEVAKHLGYDHKIIRSYLNKFNLILIHQAPPKPINNKYVIPLFTDLLTTPSLIAHSLYLCEGLHTSKTDRLSFTNQDAKLILIFEDCLRNVYKYKEVIAIDIAHNKNCVESIKQSQKYEAIFRDTTKYRISHHNDSQRKKPIIQARCGGKNLARLFIDNAYELLNHSNKQ